MSMKSSMLGIMALAGLMSQDMRESPSGGYVEPTKPIRKPEDPFLWDDTIPKGHKSELGLFNIKFRAKTYSIELLISYGSEKSRIKKLIKTEHQLYNYIKNTPDRVFSMHNQFTIISDIINHMGTSL